MCVVVFPVCCPCYQLLACPRCPPTRPKGSWDGVTTLGNTMVEDGWDYVRQCVILGVTAVCIKEFVALLFKPLKYPGDKYAGDSLSSKNICFYSFGGGYG